MKILSQIRVGIHDCVTNVLGDIFFVLYCSQKVRLPFEETTFVVFVIGQSVTIQTTFGVKVVWDGDSYLEVFVPPGFKHRMCGLCGKSCVVANLCGNVVCVVE